MAPEQYMWMHRRWKSRPPEERKAAEAAKAAAKPETDEPADNAESSES
jgi:hypothetical protein